MFHKKRDPLLFHRIFALIDTNCMRNFQKYVGCVAPTRTALSERSLARRVQFFKMKHCVDALKTCQICQITAGCGQKFMNSSSEVGEDNIKVLTTAADMLSF